MVAVIAVMKRNKIRLVIALWWKQKNKFGVGMLDHGTVVTKCTWMNWSGIVYTTICIGILILDCISLLRIKCMNIHAPAYIFALQYTRKDEAGIFHTWHSLDTLSYLLKWFFIHLTAKYCPVMTDCALSTSLKVPSPFFDTSLYLCMFVRAYFFCVCSLVCRRRKWIWKPKSSRNFSRDVMFSTGWRNQIKRSSSKWKRSEKNEESV